MILKNQKKFQKSKNFFLKSGKKIDKLESGNSSSYWMEDFLLTGRHKGEMMGRVFDVHSGLAKMIIVSFFFFFLLLIVRIVCLQIIQGDYYYSLAENNRIRIERIKAKRGIIYDRNLRPLVRNTVNFLLYFIPADLPRDIDDRNKILQKLGHILKEFNFEELDNILSAVDFTSLSAYEPLFITDNLSYEEAMLLYIESDNIPGVTLTRNYRREYLNDFQNQDEHQNNHQKVLSLSHILGYTGKITQEDLEKHQDEYSLIDYIGKSGIEYFFENELKGQDGRRHVEVDATLKRKKIINAQIEEDGYNLVLTIDLAMQAKLEEIIANNTSKWNYARASAIIMDPRNGEILSLVSYPAFDNNIFARGINQDDYNRLINDSDLPLFARAISGEYPSGSTIKPVMVVAGLEENIITEYTKINSTGGIYIDRWFFPDWAAGGHGSVNARSAIANSVNTFFYYIGGGYQNFEGLGIDRIAHYYREFGLGSQTGIDLPGEASGFVPSPAWKAQYKKEQWYIGDTYHVSIGQGDLLVTPLQIANIISVFANYGSIYRPHLVRTILSGEDQLIRHINSSPIKNEFVSDANIMVARLGMRDAVSYGSARALSDLPKMVAGKTGTAQWSSKKENHAWFTGFAPYDDPEIVITILIEEGGEGSKVAVSLAHEFLEWYLGGR